MANPFSQFIRDLTGRGKSGVPGNTDASRSLVPFGEFAPFFYNLFQPDYSLRQQMEQYKSWVYDCVTKIAAEFAAVNLKLYAMDTKGNIEEVDTHPALDLLDRVNPFMTFYDLKDLTITNLELTGNAYWWLVKNKAGVIVQIYPWLRPDRMTPIPSVKDFIEKYRYVQPGVNDPVDFKTSEIIHFKYVNPLDPYSGRSPVSSVGMSIAVDEYAQKYNLRFFQNGARPDFVLQFKDGLDKVQADRIMAQWEERHGMGNEHRPAVLSKGELKSTSLSQKDMEFYNQRMMSRDEILAAFKVPKSLLGITEDVNFATAQAARLMFIKQVIVPKVEKFCQYLNEFLLPQFAGGDSLFFDYDNPAPEDQTMRMEYYKTMQAVGALSANEIRSLEGFAPYEGGSTVFIPFNVVPGGDTDQTTTVKGMIQGTIKDIHIPRRFKFNIKPPSRTKSAKEQSITKQALVESGLAQKIAENAAARDADPQPSENSQRRKELLVINKGEEPSQLRKMWETVWNMKISKTDQQERLIMMLMKREFDRQAKQVLSSMPQPEKGYKAKTSVPFTFDANDEAKIFLNVFSPSFATIVADHGKDAMGLLGIKDFDSAHASADYKKQWVMKFSKDVNDTTRQNIKDAIDAGIKGGEDISQIRDRVQGVFTDASQGRSNTIARTEVARASNFGTLEAYKQSGVVTYTEWFTAHDEGVCDLCAPMDGQKNAMDENYFDDGDSYLGSNNKSFDMGYGNVNVGNLHPNCRCVLIPHTDDAPVMDKSTAEDAFNLKDYQGSDAEVDTAGRDLVNSLMKDHLPGYADNLNWQLQYTPVDNISFADAGDEDLVNQYMTDMKNGKQFPPITVQIDKNINPKPFILDGSHRLTAIKRLGAKIIPVIVGRSKQ